MSEIIIMQNIMKNSKYNIVYSLELWNVFYMFSNRKIFNTNISFIIQMLYLFNYPGIYNYIYSYSLYYSSKYCFNKIEKNRIFPALFIKLLSIGVQYLY